MVLIHLLLSCGALSRLAPVQDFAFGVVGFGFKTFAGAKFRTGWEVRGSHVPDLASKKPPCEYDSHVVMYHKATSFTDLLKMCLGEFN